MKTDVRCPKCNRKLCEASGIDIEITAKCVHCKGIYTYTNSKNNTKRVNNLNIDHAFQNKYI